MKIASMIAAGCFVLTLVACGGLSPQGKTTRFMAPVILNVPVNGTTTLNGFSPDGKIVGSFLASGSPTTTPYYWSSPTATPVLLNGTGCSALGVNNAGEIVGNMATGPGPQSAVYWASPSANPVTLPNPPASGPLCEAVSINNKSEIVGHSGSLGAFWDASHGTPTGFAGPGSTGVFNEAISDSSVIFFSDNSNSSNSLIHRPCYIDNLTTLEPHYIPGSNLRSNSSFFATLDQPTAQIPVTDTDSNGIVTGSEVVLSLNSLVFQLGNYGDVARFISNDGILCGTRGTGSSQIALIWQSGISSPTDMNNLIPASPNLVLKDALFQTSDGTVIGIASQLVGSATKEVYFYAQRQP